MTSLRRICIVCERLYGCKHFSGDFQPVVSKDCDDCAVKTQCPPLSKDNITGGICRSCVSDLDRIKSRR
jgi:hypothetical protein